MQQLLSISEFGRLTGIDRKTLIFYDRNGILHPIIRRENGYRYYSVSQVNELCILLTLQEMGLSLKQIEEIKKKRSAEGMDRLFRQQIPRLEERISQLQSTMDMIRQRQSHMEECRDPQAGRVRITRQQEQYYYRSDPCSIDKSGSYNETWEQFYEACVAGNISQGYPVCYLVSREDILCGRSGRAGYIAFHLGTGEGANHVLPGGTYAAACFRTAAPGPGEYSLMLKAVEEAGYHISGDSAEEILFDEVYTEDRDSFLTRISFPVERNTEAAASKG